MTDLNEKVLLALGWTRVAPASENLHREWLGPDGTNFPPPDYTNDLNACWRDLVPRIGADIEIMYDHVAGVVGCRIGGEVVNKDYAASSTGACRAICEAFLASVEGQ